MAYRMKGKLGKLAGIAAASLACLWVGAAPNVASVITTSKIEVRQVELASVRGQGGLKVRLTLVGGQAVEYAAEDLREADTLLRMTDMLLTGRARMFAELDGGNVVRAVQIAGPSPRQP